MVQEKSGMNNSNIIASIVSLSVLAFFSVLNEMVFNVSLPDIAAYFEYSPSTVNAVNSSFMLSFSFCALMFSLLADRVATMKLLVAGLTLYSAGSLTGFFFHSSFAWVVTARFVQGIGASAVPALIMVMVTKYVAADRKGQAFGIVGSVVALGEGIGPAIGGVTTQFVHWSYLFLFPLCTLAALPFLLRMLPDENKQDGRMDYTGMLILFLGTLLIILFMMTFQVGFAVGGLLFVLLYVAFALHKKENAFLPLHLFRNLDFAKVTVAGGILLGSAAAYLSLIPYMMRAVHQLSTVAIGSAVLFPGALSVILFGAISGFVADRKGSKFTASIGCLLLILSFLATAIGAEGSVWGITVFVILMFAGLSFVKTSVSVRAAAVLRESEAGAGMGFLQFFCFLAEGAGIALTGGLLSQSWMKSGWGIIESYASSDFVVYGHLLFILVLTVSTVGFIYITLRKCD